MTDIEISDMNFQQNRVNKLFLIGIYTGLLILDCHIIERLLDK